LNFDILTDYPLWFIAFCLLTGAAFAILLYYREKKNEYSNLLRWILAIIRSVAVAAIAFLLLNPLIISSANYTEKPVIVFAQDNSSSLIATPDSASFRSAYTKNTREFVSALENKFDVKTYSFGDKVEEGLKMDFDEKQTDLSALMDEIYNRFYQRNVGALIIASDGIYNRGLNPVYTQTPFNFPVYTVALGDTTPHLDVILNKVSYNRTAYLDNEFPIEIIAQGRECRGLSTDINLLKNGELIEKKSLRFNSDNDFKTVRFRVKATKPGLQKYSIRLTPLPDEISTENNRQDIYIDIQEGKQKILLLANAPHPDISAIRQAIESNINYQFDEFIVNDFDGVIDGYNLLILHGLPSIRNNLSALLNRAKAQNMPILYIITSQTQLSLFNDQSAGIAIEGARIIYNEATPYINDDFSLFSIDKKSKQIVESFPPLLSPYGKITQQPSASVLLYQKIGTVPTGEPLMLFNRTLDRKTAVILGEGVWKWRLKNFALKNDHEIFNDLISKTIQYLSLKVDKSFFRVFSKNSFTENEEIEFDAEVYNEIYELDNEPEVNFEIVNEEGTRFPYTFSKTSDAYYLNVGTYPEGSYNWTATVTSGNRQMRQTGQFTVTPLRIEKVNTVADHNVLFNLASKYGGQMVYPGQLDQLQRLITERNDIKPILYTQKKYSELLNKPWLLLIILGLISIEWFIRKRAGGY